MADSTDPETAEKVAAPDDETSPPHKTEPALSTEPQSTPSRAGKFFLLSSLCLAVFLAALDTLIVATALPSISRDLNAPDTGYAWIASAYLLAVSAPLPSWGRISDIFGRKGTLLAANVIFLVGSLIAALSRNLTTLIAGRAVQGVGAGGLLVLSNLCVSDIFSPRERSYYLQLFSGVWAFSSIIGPILGGVLSQKVSWRWCFWINLPLDGLCLVGLILFLHVHNPRTPLLAGLKAIDWLGTLTIVGATVMLLLGLNFGGVSFPWSSPTVICLIAASGLTFVIFALAQWKAAAYPLLPLEIFQNKSNLAIYGVTFSHGFSYVATLYFLPLYFQVVLGVSPLLSGVYLLPLAIPAIPVSLAAGLWLRRTGNYVIVIIGCFVFMTLGIGLLINLKPYKSWPQIIVFQIILSIGINPLFNATILAIQNSLPPKHLAVGTGSITFLRQLSAAISVVVGQVIFQSQMAGYKFIFERESIPSRLTTELVNGNLVQSSYGVRTLTLSQQSLVRGAITTSLSRMWILYTVVSGLGIVLALGIAAKTLSTEHKEYKTGLQNKTDDE